MMCRVVAVGLWALLHGAHASPCTAEDGNCDALPNAVDGASMLTRSATARRTTRKLAEDPQAVREAMAQRTTKPLAEDQQAARPKAIEGNSMLAKKATAKRSTKKLAEDKGATATGACESWCSRVPSAFIGQYAGCSGCAAKASTSETGTTGS
mmetsp:Transcript_9926/g.27018  ORF Transcript_9926/g.27018 Transcript_9926/m.27018 type:complete len:153 (-) Transcript_9926:143-601(-)